MARVMTVESRSDFKAPANGDQQSLVIATMCRMQLAGGNGQQTSQICNVAEKPYEQKGCRYTITTLIFVVL